MNEIYMMMMIEDSRQQTKRRRNKFQFHSKLKKPNPNPWIGWIVSIQYDTSEMSEVEKEKCTKIGTAPSSSKGWHGLCHDGQSVR